MPAHLRSAAVPALPSFLERPAARWARSCLIAVNVAAGTFFLLSYSRQGVSFGPYRIDLNVYRIGSAVWLRGGDLYGALPPTSSGARLPFSYPPIAAVLLAPLALAPMVVAVTLLTTVTIALTVLVLRVFLRSVIATPAPSRVVAAASPDLCSVIATPVPSGAVAADPPDLCSVIATPNPSRALATAPLGLPPTPVPAAVFGSGPAVSWWAVWWLLPAVLFLEPVRNTLNYGQVNVALMALVSADCLVVAPRWPRGVLVGIAAAVKLTPAAFVLFFLLRRDWRAGGLAALSFCACAGIGFLVAWRDSVDYWSSIIFQASRPGWPGYAANQSIQGVLARAGLDPHSPAGAVTWLVLSAVVVALACLGMRRAFAASADAWALCLNALTGLLISPISWSHHWVWGEMAVLTLATLGWRGRASNRRHDRMEHPGRTGRRDAAGLMPGRLCSAPGRTGRRDAAGLMPGRLWLAIAVAGAVVFAVSPQWWFPSGGSRELHWAAWEQAVGSSYVIFAAAVLLAAAWRPRQRRKSSG
jgi:alpha-1,2-mannosyltransferase